MSEYQYFSLLGTLLAIAISLVGWLAKTIGSLDKRVKELEVEIAVLKAISQERKK